MPADEGSWLDDHEVSQQLSFLHPQKTSTVTLPSIRVGWAFGQPLLQDQHLLTQSEALSVAIIAQQTKTECG